MYYTSLNNIAQTEFKMSMNEKMWRKAWEKNQIGFHINTVNPLLINHFDRLSLKKGECVFLPLCGKSLDIGWFLTNGYQVIGSELSELAIQQLFLELELDPKISKMGELKRYSAKNIEIFVGNIFELTRDMFRHINAVFDRGGLVALPENIRSQYIEHVIKITDNAAQLLIVYEYQQELRSGPPYSISYKEISHHFSDSYKISLLTSQGTHLKKDDTIDIKEKLYLLKPRDVLNKNIE